MNTRYSRTTGTFYPYDIAYPAEVLPPDLVEVSLDDYYAAMRCPGGHKFDFVDGQLVIVPLTGPTLSQLKEAKLREINASSQEVASGLTAGYPEFERATWPDQQAEVLAWEKDPDAATPSIDQLALYRGIDRIDYLQKTLVKVSTFKTVGLYLAGTRQRYEDQVKAAKSAADLDAIKVDFSLPQ